jgi:hypothetical protein
MSMLVRATIFRHLLSAMKGVLSDEQEFGDDWGVRWT